MILFDLQGEFGGNIAKKRPRPERSAKEPKAYNEFYNFHQLEGIYIYEVKSYVLKIVI